MGSAIRLGAMESRSRERGDSARLRRIRGRGRGLVCRRTGGRAAPARTSIEADPTARSTSSATVWGMKRAVAWIAGVGILTLALVIGLSQAGSDQPRPRPSAPTTCSRRCRSSTGAPPELAALHTQANQLLDGGLKAFNARMDTLKGTPIVINKWASWCRPCLAEFPIFQQVATERGKRGRVRRRQRQRQHEPGEEVPRPAPRAVPVLRRSRRGDRAGHQGREELPHHHVREPGGRGHVIQQGTYRDKAALEADIERYAAA